MPTIETTDALGRISPRFGALIRSRRRELHLSDWRLSVLTDISPDQLRRLERGIVKRLPKPSTLRSLATALGLPVADLVAAALDDVINL